MSALVLHVLFSNPAFILRVMWFKLFIIFFSDGGVSVSKLHLSSPLSLSMLLTPRRESRGSIYLEPASTCVFHIVGMQRSLESSHMRELDLKIPSQILMFSRPLRYFLFFSSRSSAYDMGKELAITGKWKWKRKYRSESVFICYHLLLCAFFTSILSILWVLVSCMARYLFMSLLSSLWFLLINLLSQDDSHIGPGCYVLSCLLGIQSSLAMESVAYTWTWVVCSALLIFCSLVADVLPISTYPRSQRLCLFHSKSRLSNSNKNLYLI